MNLNYTKGSIAVYVVYNQQHLINTLIHVWLKRFFLRPIAVDNILANFMGSTIMTISCLFSTIEGRCWPSYVRTASGEGHYWLHASVGSLLHEEMWFISRFLSRSLGWSQRDAHLRGWALGHWWPCFFRGEDDLNGLVAPVIHRLMLISADTSHTVCISYLYLFVLATSALHNLTPAQDRLFVRAEWLRCKRCYLGARWMPSNLFGSHTLTLEVGLGGDFVSVFDSKKHYSIHILFYVDTIWYMLLWWFLFLNVWFSLMSHPCWYPSFLYFFCW